MQVASFGGDENFETVRQQVQMMANHRKQILYGSIIKKGSYVVATTKEELEYRFEPDTLVDDAPQGQSYNQRIDTYTPEP